MKPLTNRFPLSAALIALLTSCSGNARKSQVDPDAIEAQLKSMTLREKVGQLFMIRPDVLEERFSTAELEDNSITGST